MDKQVFEHQDMAIPNHQIQKLLIWEVLEQNISMPFKEREVVLIELGNIPNSTL